MHAWRLAVLHTPSACFCRTNLGICHALTHTPSTPQRCTPRTCARTFCAVLVSCPTVSTAAVSCPTVSARSRGASVAPRAPSSPPRCALLPVLCSPRAIALPCTHCACRAAASTHMRTCALAQVSLLAIREGAADLLVQLLTMASPVIRAAAVFGLGCLVHSLPSMPQTIEEVRAPVRALLWGQAVLWGAGCAVGGRVRDAGHDAGPRPSPKIKNDEAQGGRVGGREAGP